MPGDRQKQPPQPIAFGKYTLLERISHGGMAEVFRARTMGEGGFEQIVAIKLLLPQVAQDRDFVTMMIDEAKIAGQLSHANIAQIFDLGQLEGRYYIVQEFIDGRDVRTILRNMVETGRKLDLPCACHIMSKICEGLDYAHKKRDGNGRPLNLVHRDVSPQNVLVSYEGEVKVIDFGIVKAEGRQTQTLAGLVKGKFAYMSPEQLRGLPVDRRTDVFACGILLHELLTGYPLFKRATDFDTLQRARSGEIEPPSKQNPHVPEELDRITLKALARHVDDRYQAASELRDALWEFVRSSGNLYSREEMAGWMRKTFPKGERAATATPSPVKSAAPARPGDVLAPTSEMEAVAVPDAPAPPKVVGSPVPPPREPPRGKYEPPPRLDYDDSDEDGEGDNMTLVDPELHVRMVDGARESATMREARITDDELRATMPGSQQALRELAQAAQADPERAVFTSGPDARITSSSDAVSAFERGGPGSELDQNTPLPQGWQEQMTPTKQRRRVGDPALDGVSETASTSPFMAAARGPAGGQPAQDDPLMKTMPRVTKRPDPFDRPTTPAEAGYPRVSFRDAGAEGGGGGGGANVNRNTVPRDRTPAPVARPGYESTSPPPGMGPPMPSPMPGPPRGMMGPPMPSPMPGPPHGMMGPPMPSPMPGPMGSPPGLAPPMQSPMPGPPMYSPMPGPPMDMHAQYGAPGMGPLPRGRNFYLVVGAIALLVVAATLSIVLAASNG